MKKARIEKYRCVGERKIIYNKDGSVKRTRPILYDVWSAIKNRCNNPTDKNYFRYGGRGVELCERWNEYNNFYTDMYPSFKEGLTLDRTNNNDGYNKNNCRWVDMKTQMNNTRKTVRFVFEGIEYTISEFSEKFNQNRKNVYMRLRRGLNPLTGRRNK